MITSIRNSHVQGARKLTKRGMRDARHEFLVEGARGVNHALSSGGRLSALYLDRSVDPFEELSRSARARRVPVIDVATPVMRAISSATTPPGVVAVCEFVDRRPSDLLAGQLSLVVVLAGVRDPGNAGTIVRSCAAVGVDALFLGASTVDIYNPKLVRATAGALFNIPFARNVEIDWLMEELGNRPLNPLNRVAADPKGEVLYDQVDLRQPTALVLGNEAWGVTPGLARACDALASIPMIGPVESLNVAMAATVLLFEAARQRKVPAQRP